MLVLGAGCGGDAGSERVVPVPIAECPRGSVLEDALGVGADVSGGALANAAEMSIPGAPPDCEYTLQLSNEGSTTFALMVLPMAPELAATRASVLDTIDVLAAEGLPDGFTATGAEQAAVSVSGPVGEWLYLFTLGDTDSSVQQPAVTVERAVTLVKAVVGARSSGG